MFFRLCILSLSQQKHEITCYNLDGSPAPPVTLFVKKFQLFHNLAPVTLLQLDSSSSSSSSSDLHYSIQCPFPSTYFSPTATTYPAIDAIITGNLEMKIPTLLLSMKVGYLTDNMRYVVGESSTIPEKANVFLQMEEKKEELMEEEEMEEDEGKGKGKGKGKGNKRKKSSTSTRSKKIRDKSKTQTLHEAGINLAELWHLVATGKAKRIVANSLSMNEMSEFVITVFVSPRPLEMVLQSLTKSGFSQYIRVITKESLFPIMGKYLKDMSFT